MQFGMTDDALLRQAIAELRLAGFKVTRIAGPVGNVDAIRVEAKSPDAESEAEGIVFSVDPAALRQDF